MKEKEDRRRTIGPSLGSPYKYTKKDLDYMYNKLYTDCIRKYNLKEKEAEFLATEFTSTIRERLQVQTK